jgi:hypothetical protein
MDEYFIVKKAVDIILSNLNENFIKCLINISIHDKYTYDIKLILGIIELIKIYMNTRRNDILSSCIKYTNKSYYISFVDNLFILINKHLTNTNEKQEHKYIFITDLINKYNNPIIPNYPKGDEENDLRQRLNTLVSNSRSPYVTTKEDAKDTGALFREAYYSMKNKKSRVGDINMVDIELNKLDLHNNSDLI